MENLAIACYCGEFITSRISYNDTSTTFSKIQSQTPKEFQSTRLTPIDEIMENLYLGDVDASASKHLLVERKISHILVAAGYLLSYFPSDFVYKTLDLADSRTQDIKQYFQEALNFIHSARKEDKAVFVHCAAGVSRSSTLVIAYLMALKSWTFDEAYQYVKSKRPLVCPNSGFREQLKQFQEELKTKPFRFESNVSS